MEVKVRMTLEQRSAVQAYAESQGESTTAFINWAISEAMERDGAVSTVADGTESDAQNKD